MPEILFVGTGDAFGSGGRRNSAILVRGRERTLLLDCGPTTLLGLKQLGVDPGEVDAIAISHFHGDHAAGVPFLLLEYRYELPRSKPLRILGPPGIAKVVRDMNQAFSYGDSKPLDYSLQFEELRCGGSHHEDGFRLTAHAAHHHPDTRPHMLRVDMDGRSLFFTGDTGWFEALPEVVGDSDLLISECVFMTESLEYHLDHERLERERERFRAGRILLTHLGREVLEDLDRVRFETAYDGLELKL